LNFFLVKSVYKYIQTGPGLTTNMLNCDHGLV